MDLRNLTLLAIKLLGLFFFGMAGSAFALDINTFFLFKDDDRLFKGIFSPYLLLTPALIYAIIGAILFRASGKIANCVIQTEKEVPPSLTAYNLLSAAIRVVCLYFIFKALHSLVYHLAEKILFHFKMYKAYNHYGTYNSHDEAFLLAAAIQLAAALIGWFYAKKIVEITRKISKDE
jgi:hypothetical protein